MSTAVSAYNATGFYYITNPNSKCLSVGSKGQDVLQLQKDLTQLGYSTNGTDGIYGNNTKKAVLAFQKNYGLYADGVAGAQTLSKLNSVVSTRLNSSATNVKSADSVSISGTLQKGSTGQSVTDLQSALHKLGYYNSSIDGIFGDQTKSSVIRFQKDHNLVQDGIVGNQTRAAISSSMSAVSNSAGNNTNSSQDLLKIGSKGEAVRQLQSELTSLGFSTKGVDGDFGQNTYKAVTAFQKTYGLAVDGIVGSQTKSKITELINNKNKANNNTTSNSSQDLLKIGSKGEAVRQLQSELTSLGFSTNGVDGDFGQNTYNAVTSFQKAYGLTVDGIVGNQTKSKIESLLSTSSTTNNTGSASSVGSLVYYGQADPAWGSMMYSNHNDHSQTIAASGCGPTSMAMVVSTLTGTQVKPPSTCAFAVNNGYRTYNDGTSWGFFAAEASAYGINCTETSSLSQVKDALSDGKHIVIASMGYGHFTGAGHFIVMSGVEQSGGSTWYDVLDPNTSNKSYTRYGSDGKIIDNVKNDGRVKARSDVFSSEAGQYWIFSKSNVTINSTGSTTSSPSSSADDTLRIGSKGDAVRELQKNLTALGFDTKGIDGDFGNNTYNAVASFQRTYGLTVDGIAGPQTKCKIAELLKIGTQNNTGAVGGMKISSDGVDFITSYEGFSKYKYHGQDDGNWTIGYGHVIRPGENFDNGISQADAKKLLEQELNDKYGKVVNDFAKQYNVKLTQKQFDALTSFTYNCGENVWSSPEDDFRIKKLIVHNNLNPSDITEAFTRWVKVTKADGSSVKSAGLWRRRMDEAELFNGGNYTREDRTPPAGYQ